MSHVTPEAHGEPPQTPYHRGMGKLMGVALAVVVLVGCGGALSRVKRASGPADEDHFVAHCKRTEVCLADAREVCPNGYVKESVREGARETELAFMCHGQPNW